VKTTLKREWHKGWNRPILKRAGCSRRSNLDAHGSQTRPGTRVGLWANWPGRGGIKPWRGRGSSRGHRWKRWPQWDAALSNHHILGSMRRPIQRPNKPRRPGSCAAQPHIAGPIAGVPPPVPSERRQALGDWCVPSCNTDRGVSAVCELKRP